MKHFVLLLLLMVQVQAWAQRPELVVPIGHTATVNSVAFSPDGQYVLTGSEDHTAKLWSLDGHEIQTFSGHDGQINSVAFSPDGQYVLTGSGDSTSILWTLAGGRVQTFRGHSSSVTSVAFSPDGQYVLTSSALMVKLWGIDGSEIQTFNEENASVISATFSPDGQFILTGDAKGTAQLWSVGGEKIQTFSKHGSAVSSVAFSPDGQYVLTGSRDQTAKLWTIAGREIQTFRGHGRYVLAVAFSPDGQSILTGSGDETAKLWSLDGRPIRSFRAHNFEVRSVAFSPEGQSVLTGGHGATAKRWAIEGPLIQTYGGHSSRINSVAFSPNGQSILTAGSGATAQLWSLDSREIQTFSGHSGDVFQAVFSPDGQSILTGSNDETAKLWSLDGREIQTFDGHSNWVMSVAFAPDGQSILTGSWDGTAKLWSRDGREIKTLSDEESWKWRIRSVAFSPDGQYALTGREDNITQLWPLDGREPKTFGDHSRRVYSVAFSPGGQYILTGNEDNTAQLLSLDGDQIKIFSGHNQLIHSVAFAPDGQSILTGSFDETAKLWSLDGSEARTLSSHRSGVTSVTFSPDGRYILTGSSDHTTKLWERRSGKEIATLIAIDASDWVVTTPSGLFDASPGAMRRMHYVQGLEVIALDQLKERYYEPGLLAKLMGFNKEPIRDVTTVDRPLELYPEVTFDLQDDRLDVQLGARAGGIGRVALYVDNKEVVDDVDPSRSSTIQIDLARYDKYFQAGQPARVGIQAWDAAGSLASQLQTVSYTPGANAKGNTPAPATGGGATGQPIRLFALCIGSGDYSGGTTLDLSYAEQDASQMARALELAGQELFLAAPPEVRVLTTCKDCPDADAAEYPSKANIQRALAEIAQRAGPQDVVVLYLSGHGITYEDYWYYMTPEMSSSVLTDNLVREQRAISSREFKAWMADIPARKQVIMIDACASGRLNQDFDLLAQKDIPSSQIRALNRLGSRAGLYVISASTADQVSYEASPYGMGLLTYGLLQGMLGAALRESEYVDVNRLFAYAEDQVPKLADYIGKVQKPMVYAPQGAESFDIGRVTGAVKQGITLAEAKPIFARARFSNPEEFGDDNLGLATQVNTLLRDYNYRGQKSPLIFVEGDGLPQAYALTGSYTVADGRVALRAVVRKDGEQVGEPILLPAEGDPPYSTSAADLARLSKQIIRLAVQRVH